MPMQEVFTPGRLKEYEQWMLLRKLTQNTISTYMRTLRAVYNRWMPPGTAEHNPRLFDDVYTGVVSQTKRALTARQMDSCWKPTFPVFLRSSRRYLLIFC